MWYSWWRIQNKVLTIRNSFVLMCLPVKMIWIQSLHKFDSSYHGQLKHMFIILYHLENQSLETNNFNREINGKPFLHPWNVWKIHSFNNSSCIFIRIWEVSQYLKSLPKGFPSLQLNGKDVTNVDLGY